MTPKISPNLLILQTTVMRNDNAFQPFFHRMEVTEVTAGIPVQGSKVAKEWCAKLLDKTPELEPDIELEVYLRKNHNPTVKMRATITIATTAFLLLLKTSFCFSGIYGN